MSFEGNRLIRFCLRVQSLRGPALRLTALVFLFAAALTAQLLPAPITTTPRYQAPAFDASGNTCYLSGPTTPGAAQTQPGGGTCIGTVSPGIQYSTPCPDATVTKFNPSGIQLSGTLLGGPTADVGSALAIAANGNVLLTGRTAGQFPTTSGAAIPASTTATAFAAAISANGVKILYATYLPDSIAATSTITTDAAGNAYIAGKTSTSHPLVLKLTLDGATISHNVPLGGSGVDTTTAVTVDATGDAIVAGQTSSPDFPVTPGRLPQTSKRQAELLSRQTGPRLQHPEQHLPRRQRIRQPILSVR